MTDLAPASRREQLQAIIADARRLDHIFIRGLGIPDRGAAGTVLDAHGSGDHLPIWMVATLEN